MIFRFEGPVYMNNLKIPITYFAAIESFLTMNYKLIKSMGIQWSMIYNKIIPWSKEDYLLPDVTVADAFIVTMHTYYNFFVVPPAFG